MAAERHAECGGAAQARSPSSRLCSVPRRTRAPEPVGRALLGGGTGRAGGRARRRPCPTGRAARRRSGAAGTPLRTGRWLAHRHGAAVLRDRGARLVRPGAAARTRRHPIDHSPPTAASPRRPRRRAAMRSCSSPRKRPRSICAGHCGAPVHGSSMDRPRPAPTCCASKATRTRQHWQRCVATATSSGSRASSRRMCRRRRRRVARLTAALAKLSSDADAVLLADAHPRALRSARRGISWAPSSSPRQGSWRLPPRPRPTPEPRRRRRGSW